MSIIGIGIIILLIIVAVLSIVTICKSQKEFDKFDDGIKGWR